MQWLEEVFQRLLGPGLKLKPTNYESLQKEIRYLVHIVSASGVSPDPEKVTTIRDWPTFRNL